MLLSKAIKFIILEGVESDKVELNELYPESKQEISKLSPKWIMWLYARFGPNPKREEIHPFEDALTTILAFSKKDSAINQKYSSSEQWRKAVDLEFDPQKRKWKTPADVITMSVDDMETLLAMSQQKKQNVDIKEANIEGDFLTKIGPWNLWMPSTKENSCVIAGSDPLTGKSATSWCTARTSGSNLFYNYVARNNSNVVLFYVIKDNATEPNDHISIGFVNGEPNLNGDKGGVSVNGKNDGITEKILKKILGSYYETILNVLSNKSKEISGKHPAKAKVKEAALNINAFHNILKGLSQDESTDMKSVIGSQYEISEEIALKLTEDTSSVVRATIAINRNVPIKSLIQLANDKDNVVRSNVAANPNTPIETLIRLANDKIKDIRANVSRNLNASPEILIRLANDKIKDIRANIAVHQNTPIEILKQLANDVDYSVRNSVAININTPAEALMLLANDESSGIKYNVARNSNTPPEILTQLTNSENVNVRNCVASNINTPIKALIQLTKDEDSYVRANVARNSNTPIEILAQIANDEDNHVSNVAKEKIRERNVREVLVRNVVKRIIQKHTN